MKNLKQNHLKFEYEEIKKYNQFKVRLLTQKIIVYGMFHLKVLIKLYIRMKILL